MKIRVVCYKVLIVVGVVLLVYIYYCECTVKYWNMTRIDIIINLEMAILLLPVDANSHYSLYTYRYFLRLLL